MQKQFDGKNESKRDRKLRLERTLSRRAERGQRGQSDAFDERTGRSELWSPSALLELDGIEAEAQYTSPAPLDPERGLTALRGYLASRPSGRAAPGGVRRAVEQALGTALPGVRIHDDETAGGIAEAMDARALTVGTDILLGKGETETSSRRGMELLAHELAHVAEHPSRVENLTLELGGADAYAEHAADAVAAHALGGTVFGGQLASSPAGQVRAKRKHDDRPELDKKRKEESHRKDPSGEATKEANRPIIDSLAYVKDYLRERFPDIARDADSAEALEEAFKGGRAKGDLTNMGFDSEMDALVRAFQKTYMGEEGKAVPGGQLEDRTLASVISQAAARGDKLGGMGAQAVEMTKHDDAETKGEAAKDEKDDDKAEKRAGKTPVVALGDGGVADAQTWYAKGDNGARLLPHLPKIAKSLGLEEKTTMDAELIEAIAQFQKKHSPDGVKGVDGKLGPKSLALLSEKGGLDLAIVKGGDDPSGKAGLDAANVWPDKALKEGGKFDHYAALLAKSGQNIDAATADRPILVGLRGLKKGAKKTHQTKSTREYDDTFVLIWKDGEQKRVMEFSGATHPYQKGNNKYGGVAMIKGDTTYDVSTIGNANYYGYKAPHVKYQSGAGKAASGNVPAYRQKDGDGLYTSKNEKKETTANAILFHPGYDTKRRTKNSKFSSIGCQTANGKDIETLTDVTFNYGQRPNAKKNKGKKGFTYVLLNGETAVNAANAAKKDQEKVPGAPVEAPKKAGAAKSPVEPEPKKAAPAKAAAPAKVIEDDAPAKTRGDAKNALDDKTSAKSDAAKKVKKDSLTEKVLTAVTMTETKGVAVESRLKTSAGVKASYKSKVQATAPWSVDHLKRHSSLQTQFGVTKKQLRAGEARMIHAKTVWKSVMKSGQANAADFVKANADGLKKAGFDEADIQKMMKFRDFKNSVAAPEAAAKRVVAAMDADALWSQATPDEQKKYGSAEALKSAGANVKALRGAVLARKKKTIVNDLGLAAGLDTVSTNTYAKRARAKRPIWGEDRAAWQRVALEKDKKVGDAVRKATEHDGGMTMGRAVIGKHVTAYQKANPKATAEQVVRYVATKHNKWAGKPYADKTWRYYQNLYNKKSKKTVRRHSAGGDSAGLATNLPQAEQYMGQSSGGRAVGSEMVGAIRGVMGADVSNVRLHTDTAAAQAARSLNAEAFTVGKSVYFGAGKYAPKSGQGMDLLLHELAHTWQADERGTSAPGSSLNLGSASSASERAADTAASKIGSALRGAQRGGLAKTSSTHRSAHSWTAAAAGRTLRRKKDPTVDDKTTATQSAKTDAEKEEAKRLAEAKKKLQSARSYNLKGHSVSMLVKMRRMLAKQGYLKGDAAKLDQTDVTPESVADDAFLKAVIAFQKKKLGDKLKGAELEKAADGQIGPSTFALFQKQGLAYTKAGGAHTPEVEGEDKKKKKKRQIVPKGAPAGDVYDHFQSLVTDNGGLFDTRAGFINVVGVRGATYDHKAGTVTHTQNTLNKWNDTILVLSVDDKGAKQVKTYSGTTDPGVATKGVATLPEGTYAYKKGTHKGYHALNPQYESVTPAIRNGNAYLGTQGPLGTKGAAGINIHTTHGKEGSRLTGGHKRGKLGGPGNYSTGCTVIDGTDQYKGFMDQVNTATKTKKQKGAGQKTVYYTVISAGRVGEVVVKTQQEAK